ncbi:MAG: hypothetical protein QNJ63_11970, partial [Calothrix sp. MO_192.B10]|nr:hypothetical protein [Calothrix sp. MO_192.B10]
VSGFIPCLKHETPNCVALSQGLSPSRYILVMQWNSKIMLGYATLHPTYSLTPQQLIQEIINPE